MKQKIISAIEDIDKTDWNRVDAMQDADIDCSDNPEWTEIDLAIATKRYAHTTPHKLLVDVPVSLEVVTFFQAMGDCWQARMNNVLREYMQQQLHRSI